MSDSRKTRGSTVLLVLSVILLLVLVIVPMSVEARVSKTSICIRSCAHCKDMYHDYFNSKLCADFCLQMDGSWNPDCGSPMDAKSLIPFFLQRLE